MLRRFWVDPENIQGSTVQFVDDSFHHLVRVSRKAVGDQVEVLDGTGKAFTVELTEVGKRTAAGKLIGERTLPVPQKPYVNLAFCFPKPANFELVLEKAVELGCHSITPVISEFAFVAKKKDFPHNREPRWAKIIKGATEQSGRADIMPLNPVISIEEFQAQINQNPKALGLFLYEGDCALDLRQYLKGQDVARYDEIWALIGSEGGFSKDEVVSLNAKGFKSLTLGKQILRTETACVSILSVLQYELGHLS